MVSTQAQQADDAPMLRTLSFANGELAPAMEAVQLLAEEATPLDPGSLHGTCVLLWQRLIRLTHAGVRCGLFRLDLPEPDLSDSVRFIGSTSQETFIEAAIEASGLSGSALPFDLAAAQDNNIDWDQPEVAEAVRYAVDSASWMGVDLDLLGFASRAVFRSDQEWWSDVAAARSAFESTFDFCLCEDQCNCKGGNSAPAVHPDSDFDWLFDGAPKVLSALAETAEMNAATERILAPGEPWPEEWDEADPDDRFAPSVYNPIANLVPPLHGIGSLVPAVSPGTGSVDATYLAAHRQFDLRLRGGLWEVWRALETTMPSFVLHRWFSELGTWDSPAVREILRSTKAPFSELAVTPPPPDHHH